MKPALVLGALLGVALAAGLLLADQFGDSTRPTRTPRHHHSAWSLDPTEVPPPQALAPQGRVPQFVVECDYSHRAPDDPIVAPGAPGASHSHDFFGATTTHAGSTAQDLVASDTTCNDPADTAAYWAPSLLVAGEALDPARAVAYYRAGPGIDPAVVDTWPLGLELLAGDPMADGPQPLGVVAWHCGNAERLSSDPPTCGERAPLALRLTFPDCWNGRDLASADNRSHVAYSVGGTCGEDHPTPITQLVLVVQYPFAGEPADLTLSSGPVHTAHGDVLNGWRPDGLRRHVERCLNRHLVCSVSSTRTLR